MFNKYLTLFISSSVLQLVFFICFFILPHSCVIFADSTPCEDYNFDSLSVRMILDTNGLTDQAIETISEVTEGRITSLDFLKISYLPPEIGKLTALTSLDLGSNKLTSLPPEIGQLTLYNSFFLKAICLLQFLRKSVYVQH